jgi:hypothetical protein
MSAVASAAEYASTPGTPALEIVALTPDQIAEKEMYRWMLWFGLPSLVAALFVAAVFATGSIWWIGGAIVGVIGAISVLIWLAMTSSVEGN